MELEESAWQDAGRAAWFAWEGLRDAPTVARAARAMGDLNDAMTDLASWLPGYNVDTGEVSSDGD